MQYKNPFLSAKENDVMGAMLREQNKAYYDAVYGEDEETEADRIADRLVRGY